MTMSLTSSSDGSGSIDREEFLQIPQIATNPLASRMIAIFDEECVPFGGVQSKNVQDSWLLQWGRHSRFPRIRWRVERIQ